MQRKRENVEAGQHAANGGNDEPDHVPALARRSCRQLEDPDQVGDMQEQNGQQQEENQDAEPKNENPVTKITWQTAGGQHRGAGHYGV